MARSMMGNLAETMGEQWTRGLGFWVTSAVPKTRIHVHPAPSLSMRDTRPSAEGLERSFVQGFKITLSRLP